MRSVLPILLVGGAAVGMFAAYHQVLPDVWSSVRTKALAADLALPSPELASRAAAAAVESPRDTSPSPGAETLPAAIVTQPIASDPPTARPEGDEVLFAAPPVPAALPPLPEGAPAVWTGRYPGPSETLRASAYAFNARVFDEPASGASTLAVVRRGGLLDVTESVNGTGCRHGRWFAVAPEGYICTRSGFGVYDWDKRFGRISDAPDVTRGLPYHYGKLIEQGAPRLYRVPSADEAERIELASAADAPRGASLPDVVESRLNGAYFLALAADETSDTGRWLHTVRGRVLRHEAVQPLPHTRMRGAQLIEGQPVAFVVTHDAPVLDATSGQQVGRAERYARFAIEGQVEREGERYARAPGGRLIAMQDVRRVRPVARPSGVSSDDRWMHVDLAQQVLVAYEGDLPVFATLVASGIQGHRTPVGLYQVREKHITTTMRGPDPDMGVYEVEEVPWTQYFHYSYALHGAYWHDAFGKVRSHGCVNLPPEDARWLFEWSAPEMPQPWHGRRKQSGTWVYTTRS